MNNKCQVDLLSALQILALPPSTARLPFTLRWGGRDKENIVQRSWFEILLPYIAPWSTSESQSVRARADWVSYQSTSVLDRFGARPEAGTCSGIMKLVSDTAGTSIQVAWLSCHVMEIDPAKRLIHGRILSLLLVTGKSRGGSPALPWGAQTLDPGCLCLALSLLLTNLVAPPSLSFLTWKRQMMALILRPFHVGSM